MKSRIIPAALFFAAAMLFFSCSSVNTGGTNYSIPRTATTIQVAKIGDIYYADNTTSSPQEYNPNKKAVGVVCSLADGAVRSIVSLHESAKVWAPDGSPGFSAKIESSDTDGNLTWQWIKKQQLGANDAATNYPAFYWCECYDKIYGTGGRTWYLPAISEIYTLYEFRVAISAGLAAAGGEPLSSYDYWSATQFSKRYARVGNPMTGDCNSNRQMADTVRVRAVSKCF